MNKVFEKIIEKLEDAKSNVPVNRLLDDIIKDKPKELGQLMAYNKSIDIVKQEAEQYNNGWIPCSERLPDDASDCIVTVDYLCDEKIVDYGWFDGHRWLVGMDEYTTSIITAWQPLPEPYKE